MEDEVWRKTPIDGKQPFMEDDLWQNATFDGRHPLIGLQYITWKKMFTTPHQLSKLETEFRVMEEMYLALCMCTYAEKTTFLGKDA